LSIFALFEDSDELADIYIGIQVALQYIKTDHTGEGDSIILPNLSDTPYNPVAILHEYLNLVPIKTGRFLLNFQTGKYTHQPVGKGKIAKLPFKVASYNKLPDPKIYTEHSL
jgi:hypothetical protein